MIENIYEKCMYNNLGDDKGVLYMYTRKLVFLMIGFVYFTLSL